MIGSSGTRIRNNILAALLLSAFAASCTAQAQVGTELCACQPSEYTITLDFGAECDDKTIDKNVLGIEDSVCFVNSAIVGAAVTDPFPVTVSSILITELDQDLQNRKQGNITGVFVNGDEVNYTSYTVAGSGNISVSAVPRGLQMSVFALNAAGETLVNRVVILYTNNCTEYPVLQGGMQIGWVVFSLVSAPTLETCPIANVTVSPTPATNATSSPNVTDAPSVAPRTMISPNVTEAPSMAPNAPVSPNRTDAPSIAPNNASYTGHDQVGTELCACQPSEYTITLDFGAECDDKTIDESVPGIEDSVCFVNSAIVGAAVADPFPVTVSSILITELDQDLQDLKQENNTGVFVNGDEVNYTSYTVAESGNISATAVPRGLQMTVFALNAAGETLVNRVVILYTNNCTEYPVLQEGMKIGWVVFSLVSAPTLETCPVTNVTVYPTTAPNAAISLNATEAPSMAPNATISPNDATTSPNAIEAPSMAPSAPISPNATEAPSIVPNATFSPYVTEAPSIAPNNASYTGHDQVGTELCACQPSEYTITLDFGAECDDKTIDESVPGIEDSVCFVNSAIVGAAVADPFPVTVSSILITELDQDLQDLKQENNTGVFVNGDEVNYTSYTVAESGNISATAVPRGLQMTVFALNAAGETLVNRVVILYTNNCTENPVLQEGMQIGWVVFASVSAPTLETCPIANATVSPTMAPNATISPNVTDAPSMAPNATISPNVTDAPSMALNATI